MKSFIALGANLLDPKAQLEKAAESLALRATILRASPIITTPALVPTGAPQSWRKPFHNAVVEIDWQDSPRDLLSFLKKIEMELGRKPSERWAPREIDLDILSFGEKEINEPELQIPHPEIANRQFVLTPLKHLSPSWKIPGKNENVLSMNRDLQNPLPLWMGILNLTPDSFSDGNELSDPINLEKRLDEFDAENIHFLDLGAESTRPGAHPVLLEEEWRRLAPALKLIQKRYGNRIFRPLVSVDTHHPKTAQKALQYNVDIINDVSGLNSNEMLNVLRESECQYVLMHSLSVPADPSLHIRTDDSVSHIRDWALKKLEQLDRAGIKLDRVIFDPGIGFGKSAEQSLKILRRIHEFLSLPVRILVGHSRKSFMQRLSQHEPYERDFETLGISFALLNKKVDILRVHAADAHSRAFRTFQETQ